MFRLSAIVCGWLLLFLAVSPLTAQRDARVPDPDPEIERKSFQVAEGFEVNLFAGDPLLAKPIQMSFDAQGRLWVATSETYPQIKPGEKANDKILVLEDRDHDGKAERTTVFADGLLIPTGIEPGDGGVYVADSTDLLHLADTDGDGKADRRRVILSGFGTEDTHHILHAFRWGPEGLLYFNQSIYIHSHIETPHGVRRLNAGGVWQFRPENRKLEVYLRGFCNPWGHHFDRWGQSFVTDGAYGEGINYGLPGAYYVFAQPSPRLLGGLNPGSPKHCGLEIVSGRHLPDDWQGNMITNDFRGHRVCRFVVSEDGAGYSSREMPELIKTTHPAFRPVDVKMGPDGAIYIADWYNPIIQHGEVDFRDPRRDRTHGRIWRVTRKGRAPVAPRKLVGAPVEELLDALGAPEDWTRLQAKRVLKERGAEILSALETWVRERSREGNNPEREHLLLEGLWVYQALDTPSESLLRELLDAKDHRARAAAARVAGHWHDRLPEAAKWLAMAAKSDPHPRVRLEAVRALAQIPTRESAEAALVALDQPMDKFLDYALWLTARDLEPQWMPAVRNGQLPFADVRHLIFALQALDTKDVARPLATLVKAGKVPAEGEARALEVLAGMGGAEELGVVLDRALSRPGPVVLASLGKAWRERGLRPSGDLARISSLFDAPEEAVRAEALRLASYYKLPDLRSRLLDLARAEMTSETLRRAALDGLVALGGTESREALEALSGPGRPFSPRQQAVVALTNLDLEAAARRAAEVLAEAGPGVDPTELFTAFLERRNGTAALTRSLAEKKLPADLAKVGVRLVRTSPRGAPALVDVLTKAGGLTAPRKAPTPAEVQTLTAEVLAQGNAARGELVFRRADQVCLKCHAIAGAGGQVGPDLSSIGASAQPDYLVESLLLPNKAIKENYHALIVDMKDGRQFTGVKVRESRTELVLRNSEDREILLPPARIEERRMGGSLMPEGLTDSLTRGELLDLVRFLTELGKVGPYGISKARLARRWQTLEPTKEAYTLLSRTSYSSAASESSALTWQPTYSTVAGTLPTGELPVFTLNQGKSRMSFVRAQLDVTTAGSVRLLLDTPKGLSLWLDGQPLEPRAEVTLDVTTGLRTLTIGIDRNERSDSLRLELEDVPGSPARARLVTGK